MLTASSTTGCFCVFTTSAKLRQPCIVHPSGVDKLLSSISVIALGIIYIPLYFPLEPYLYRHVFSYLFSKGGLVMSRHPSSQWVLDSTSLACDHLEVRLSRAHLSI